MMIWSFKRKQHPYVTLNKYKARLCCHGEQQQWEFNYRDTYSPVVSWYSICILMTTSKLQNLHTESVDSIQEYLHTKLKSMIFLRLTPGIELANNKNEMVLKLVGNLYGLKDTGQT